jgi:glycerol-3-phosphate O-acyltransferase / dihydroxyacetone phosphate acyltransferase
MVEVGEPLPAGALPAGDTPADVRALTERIAEGLAAVTLSFASWDEAALLAQAADLWLQPDPELPVQPTLPERVAARRQVLAAYRDLGGAGAPALQPLAASLAAYQRLLAAFGLRDEQVGAAYPLPSVLRFLLHSLWVLIVRLPLAVAGVALGVVPWWLCSWLAARVAHQPDQPGTYKLFGGILLYPLCWGIEAALAARLGGWRWGAAVAVLGPLGGWAAVRCRDRLRLLLTEARAYLLLRGGGRLGRELRRRRRLVLADLHAVAARLGVEGVGRGEAPGVAAEPAAERG